MNDAQESQFVRHLFERVKSELTGRALEEILDEGPRDRFHAGVLLPLPVEAATLDTFGGEDLGRGLPGAEGAAIGARWAPASAITPDSQSAMGMDFQIFVPVGVARIRLRVSPRITVWYPIFPTRDEILAAQHRGGAGETEDEQDAGGEAAVGGARDDNEGRIVAGDDPADQETVPNVAPDELPSSAAAPSSTPAGSIPRQIAADVSQTLGRRAKALDDVVVVPRKFRKREVAVDPIDLTVDPARLTTPLELRDELDAALLSTRDAILRDDQGVWRHLGAPSDAVREIRGDSVLSSDEALTAALREAAGEPALPTWRAYVTVSGEPSLFGEPRASLGPGQLIRMNVSLVNATPALTKSERRRAQIEECALFDCGFTAEVMGSTIVPFEFQGAPEDYRYDRLFDAIGSNCTALPVAEQPHALTTETVPLYEQPWYRTRGDLPIAFAALDDREDADVFGELGRIAEQMEGYLSDWDEFLRSTAPGSLDAQALAACMSDRNRFAGEVEGYKLGIEALRRDPRLLRAFRLMNRVFFENGRERTPAIAHWRLFQIAFIVMQLPALAAREQLLGTGDDFTQRLQDALSRVDVLWFPTGGGKTEAYLGLIATALFYDRLRGKQRGVTAWMRFPLRMLSLQQLERLSRVVARAELIRAREPDLARGDSDPFSIGYYVGGGNTPNRIREADLKAMDDSSWARQQILRTCPYCGHPVTMVFRRHDWRLTHQCANESCYTNTSSRLGRLTGALPLFIVDNEIYRYRPSVLVGTVDKLAVLGFQKHFAHLVSSVQERCPLHGYASFGQCVEGSSGGPCQIKPRQFERVSDERDPVPAFLIQDELHLLKEELGTFNGHYEGFLSYVPTLQGHQPSKILAATATIEAYETQTFHLYLKSANRFPQPGWREGETFYATSRPLRHRRLYAGVLTHQRSPEDAVLRVLEIYNHHIRHMRADPATALAELEFAGVTEAEFLDFLHLYDLSVVYVNRKGTGGNIAYRLGQAAVADQQGPLRATMLTGDNTMTEVGHVIERVERERRDVDESRLDVLIATSLISHGVDLERINFLCMTGMPSKYAEYIQASSRAARNHVGLVVACFKRGDLRERSQYHYFVPNHRYLDRLVEPVPINRFSAFAARRTVPGLLAGLLLSHYSRRLYGEKRIGKALDDLRTLRQAIGEQDVTREQVMVDLEAIIGVRHPLLGQVQQRYLQEAVDAALESNWDQILRSRESHLGDAVHPMSSFRDVDDALTFVGGPSSVVVERIRSN